MNSPELVESILTVKDLTTSLRLSGATSPITIVDRMSFNLQKGKTLALVGESGCGKSMTALSLMRILPRPEALPSTGEVIYRGQNLLKLSEKEMRKIAGGKIAMIFQDPTTALNPVFTIGNQLMEVANLHLNLFGNAALERVMMALKEVGIPDPKARVNAYPHQLSGGMKQRAMIAMALMCEPDVLIADEPTTALDVTIQAEVLALIASLQRKNHMATLLITHDMGVVAEMADEVIVMYAGQAVESGSVQKIFDEKAHPYTQELFASRSSIHVPKARLHTIKGEVPSPSHLPRGCRFHPRCPFAFEKCFAGDVPNFIVNEDVDHLSRCWLS